MSIHLFIFLVRPCNKHSNVQSAGYTGKINHFGIISEPLVYLNKCNTNNNQLTLHYALLQYRSITVYICVWLKLCVFVWFADSTEQFEQILSQYEELKTTQ